MSVKKSMGIIIGIGIVAVLVFGFVLYATIKTKSTGISRYSPYKEWMDKTVQLDQEAVLLTEKVRLFDDRTYPYLLLDSLHPDWPYLAERIKLGDYILVAKLPADAAFHIEKAVQYTGGVSGNSTPFVFGTVSYGGKSYKVGYQWGTMNIGKFMDKVKACWQFHRAPWQTETDTVFYELPEARWW